MIIKSSNLTN